MTGKAVHEQTNTWVSGLPLYAHWHLRIPSRSRRRHRPAVSPRTFAP